MFFQAVAALFAVYMLIRHVPRAAAALGGGRRGGRAGATVAILNVVLALAILVVSVKGLAAGLIRR
jgi:hypothetical protein